MVLTTRIFLTNRENFNFDIFFIIHLFPDARARKRPQGFDNRLLKKFYLPWNQFFIMKNFSDFFHKVCVFSSFLKILSVFGFFQPQVPRKLL